MKFSYSSGFEQRIKLTYLKYRRACMEWDIEFTRIQREDTKSQESTINTTKDVRTSTPAGKQTFHYYLQLFLPSIASHRNTKYLRK